jgi:hypothetical protein
MLLDQPKERIRIEPAKQNGDTALGECSAAVVTSRP